jgi:iron complex outermembrane receptor protein
MPYFIYDQSDVFFLGSDISLERKISENIKSTSTFNYLWSKNLKKNDKIINQPPIKISNNFVIKTKQFWNINFSEISIFPSYTFKQFQAPITISPEKLTDGSLTITKDSEIFDIKDAPDGYFLFDLSWKIKINDFSTSIIIKNLFDKKYRNYLNQMRYFADDLGRNFLINLSYSFNKI